MSAVALINSDGSQMSRPRPGGNSAFGGMRPTAYQAADPISQELASWRPFLGSADSDLLYERDRITARIRDLVRNNGWASSIVTSELDNVIGAGLRLSAKPDWRALGQTPEWAAAFGTQLEGLWRTYAHDPRCYCDAARHYQMGGLFGLAYRHYLIEGTALAALLWLPGRGSIWSTALQIIDPDRLSNPMGRADNDTLRAGVEIDEYGAAVAYHIRKRHPHDVMLGSGDAFIWERVLRETSWGRPIVIHFYDKDRSGQSGGVGRLTPILERLKMLDKYDKVELQAAVLNAILAAFIESPFDHELLDGIISDGKVGNYQDARTDFHDKKTVTLGGLRVPTLFPGEKISMLNAARPNTAFADFEAACLRNVAAGTGMSYEQISRDWSRTNYSSARAALLEVWKTLSKRRTAFGHGFATPVYMAFVEEAIDRGDVVLPKGAPDFYDAVAAYCGCKWIGPGRGWVDPVKEKQGAVLGMAAGMSTLEDECAEQGKDYQEVLAQIRREISEMPEGVLHPAQVDFAKVAMGNNTGDRSGAESTTGTAGSGESEE